MDGIYDRSQLWYSKNMKYKRILIKLSGEALLGSRQSGIDPKVAQYIATEIKKITDAGAEVAVVVGGGNIYRGENYGKDGIQEETGHYIGMLAICINSLALTDLFNSFGLQTEALTAIGAAGKMKEYSVEAAKKVLADHKVLLLSGGTGKPFCSSDSGASLRAEELDMDVIFKVTKVDGVYDSDPVKNPDAKKFSTLSFDEAIEKDLKVMDKQAFLMCKEHDIPIIVFKMEEGNIEKAAMGQEIGTTIS